MSTKLSQNLPDEPVSEQAGGITSRICCVAVAVACLAVLLALSGCSTSHPLAIPSPKPTSSLTPSPTTTPTPVVAICTAGQLQPWAGPNGAAAGSQGSEFAFTNVSSQKCALYGYPEVQMLDGSGIKLPTTDQPATPGFDSVNPEPVVIGPGQRAYFLLFYANATGYSGAGTCPTSAELQFTPPALTTTLTLTGVGAQITPYGGSVENLQCGQIMVTPVTSRKLLPATVGS